MTTNIETIAPINHDELRERLRSLRDTEGLSQNAMAARIGVSSATLSGFLSGEYKGDMNKVAGAALKWLNQRSASVRLGAVLPVAPRWIETPTALKIYDALAFAQMANDIALIYGGAGFGKTKTIRRYQEQKPNVWAVTATPATASVGVILEECANAMGLRDFPLHPAKLQRAIVSKVRDTEGLLIVDEAQHLTKASLEELRSIHDATEIGLAFSGNATVYNSLFKGNENGFAQLFSRVGKRVPLTRPLAGDVAALAAAFGVKGEKELQRLEEIAKQPGALRGVVKTLRIAALAADGEAPTRAHIEHAWRERQGDIMSAEAAHA